MELRTLPLVTGLLPIGAVISAYLIAAYFGHVPSCVPLFDGCTTISSAGRDAPESLLFRATMIPTAMLLMLYWRLAGEWLIRSGDPRTRAGRVMIWLGSIAAVFLIVYTVALGFIGEHYALQRRIGVTLFFAFTFLAQLLLVHRLGQLIQATRQTTLQPAYRIKVSICVAMLALGLAVSPLKAIYPDHTFIENIVEWNFALLMYLFFVATSLAWRSTSFAAEFSVRFPDKRGE
ncbi:MAG: hypothetical protein FD165_431 [Gammaproteobacteria bacterium]|nr:MAG: hypothetical protein FD165_431 [Gammaproteobacteria bacterium]TND02306.1 MAG: hypothetical protein FD120_2470 [Gammaproteobacteria bacterium]